MRDTLAKKEFFFDLPEHLIAQYPAAQRSASRLLHLSRETGACRDLRFADLPGLLRPGDLLVFNDTQVIPARLHGHKASGGKVEVLVERLLDTQRVLAQVRASKSPKPGTRLVLENAVEAEVLGRDGEFFELRFLDPRPALELLETYGHIPLPPYIRRPDGSEDSRRYQTVYAREPGAVAAPTAGLHFDHAMLEGLAQAGVEQAFVTLHVGAGTFQPVRVDDLREHRMHAEYFQVSVELCERVARARQRGGRVVAVGTTSVRALESAAQDGGLSPSRGETRLFITPGYRFQVVDALLTNFHLPESTLLVLVSAFAGKDAVLAAYRHAVAQGYRFFSYGDAMFLG